MTRCAQIRIHPSPRIHSHIHFIDIYVYVNAPAEFCSSEATNAHTPKAHQEM